MPLLEFSNPVRVVDIFILVWCNAGNYGGAWQQQKIEFSRFPGPIVMTTNCIIEPRKSYKNRIFTRRYAATPSFLFFTLFVSLTLIPLFISRRLLGTVWSVGPGCST
jgi:hypothetical protein